MTNVFSRGLWAKQGKLNSLAGQWPFQTQGAWTAKPLSTRWSLFSTKRRFSSFEAPSTRRRYPPWAEIGRQLIDFFKRGREMVDHNRVKGISMKVFICFSILGAERRYWPEISPARVKEWKSSSRNKTSFAPKRPPAIP